MSLFLPDKPSRIVLIGLSGAGKSTVAALIAERLGWRCRDTDEMVALSAGKPVPEVFAQDGEAVFRALEHQALREACRERQVVVATGGGAVLSPDNRSLLVDGCFLVCLDAPVEALNRRVGPHGGRPLLAGDDAVARIRDLKAFRHPFYGLADCVLATEDRAPAQVADDVIDAWRQAWFSCTVRTPGGRHGIAVGWGLLDGIGASMASAGLKGQAHLVTDSHVYRLYGERLLKALAGADISASAYVVPAGEASKTLDNAAALYDWLVAQRAERRQAVIALGGGVVSDLAGFVAATYLRGVPLVHVPTSLLGMVDAAIGGKTAVNHRDGKNLIGAFYQPKMVIADVSLLTSLAPREIRSGWAEVIKHALIMDPDLLDLMERRVKDLVGLDPEAATAVVRRSMALKAAVVSEDEREETGRRAILNYGHTIGHALETAGDYSELLHGEAVAIGMVGAAEVGRKMGITPAGLAERQREIIQRFSLPVAAQGFGRDRVMAAMALDKKVVNKAIQWVLLEEMGRPVLRSDVPMALVEDVVSQLVRR